MSNEFNQRPSASTITLKYSAPVTAIAHPNIALIKYWGKRDAALNIPAAGSMSLTLDGLQTRTSVAFVHKQDEDEIIINNRPATEKQRARIVDFLDLVRAIAGVDHGAYVETANDFPTSAGLASSASGFAALAVAAAGALRLDLSRADLSALARRGSGSAARSIYGGFALMNAGVRADGADAYAVQLAPQEHWDLRCLIALCDDGEKPIGSTEAMEQTAHTSPYYPAWVEDVPLLLNEANQAVERKDFGALAVLSEASCLRMHASAMAAATGILYWKGVTVELIHAVRQARAEGFGAFFTIDAGPHVKVFCLPTHEEHLANLLRSVPGVRGLIRARPGQGARIVS